MSGTSLPPLSFSKRRAICCPEACHERRWSCRAWRARLSAMLRSVSDGVHGAVLSDSSRDMSGLRRHQRLETSGIRAHSRSGLIAAVHGLYLSNGMRISLRSKAMPCRWLQIDVARGASHAGRRWIWHPELGMPRPPLSGSTTLRHARSPNITPRSAANYCCCCCCRRHCCTCFYSSPLHLCEHIKLCLRVWNGPVCCSLFVTANRFSTVP